MVCKLSSVPIIYRLAGTLIVLIPLFFCAISLLQGHKPSPLIVPFILLCIFIYALYWKAGVYVKVSDTYIDARLFPFPKVRLAQDSIRSISLESVAPLTREWGNRGKRGPGKTLFLDAGQNKKCVEIKTADKFTLQLGIRDDSDLSWMDCIDTAGHLKGAEESETSDAAQGPS